VYAAERHEAILERARANGRVEVGALAEELGVTVETVRRDLTALERLGVVRRVHGKELTVVTNSITIASTLADRPGIELMMLGGRIRYRTGAAVGTWTTSALSDVYTDVAFLGTNGFSVERGFTTPDQAEAVAKAAMTTAARRVIMVADATKAGQVHLHRFATVDQVAMLLTDSSLDEDTVEEFDAAGVEVVRA
jgi:DeoR family fructose operon transcriptional repressor